MESFWLANKIMRLAAWGAGRAFVMARWMLSWTVAIVVGIVGVFVHRGLVDRRARRMR